MDRCERCDRPRSTPEDVARYEHGEGDHLCWSSDAVHCVGDAVDWRARALATEARIERLVATKYVKALRRYLKVEFAAGWMGALSKRAGQADVVVTFTDLRAILAGLDMLAVRGAES